MTQRVFSHYGGAIITSVLLLTACGPQGAPTKAVPPASPANTQAETKQEEASFDPDKGLYLRETTREAMGITTAPVQKKTFRAERTIKFQVFREADEKPLPGMFYRSGSAYASTILTGQIDELKIGQMGQVLAQQGSQEETTATLFQINAVPSSSQNELLVEVADPHHRFILGDFCTVRWQLAAVEAPIAVPDSALLNTTEGDFVYLQKDDRFVRTPVKVGAKGEGFIAITEGIATSDSLVTNPVQALWLTELKLKSGGSEP